MMVRAGSARSVIVIAALAGLVQVAAGIAMYLAGIYFASWSMLVSVAVLLGCIVVGVRQIGARAYPEGMGYRQAFQAGSAIALGTGMVYAVYNLVSIRYFYPGFLDEVVRTRILQLDIRQLPHESFEVMRAGLSAPMIALPNLVRLTVIGTVLSALTAGPLRTRK